jgi:hypothetical protein
MTQSFDEWYKYNEKHILSGKYDIRDILNDWKEEREKYMNKPEVKSSFSSTKVKCVLINKEDGSNKLELGKEYYVSLPNPSNMNDVLAYVKELEDWYHIDCFEVIK